MFSQIFSIFKASMEIYEHLCRPVCKEYGIQQTGLDILVYLSRNPDSNAVDIQKCNGIKQSMVSFHVDKLVNDGYLERQSVAGDRRKIRLVCTDKAKPVIEAGENIRTKYMEIVSKHITAEDKEAIERVMAILNMNISDFREQEKKG